MAIMEARTGAFTLRVDCPACGLPVPLNAPTKSAHCHACTKDFDVPALIFVRLLMRFDDLPDETTPFADGAHANIDGVEAHATRTSKTPECGSCGKALVIAEPPSDALTKITCASCSAEAIGFPAPAWLTEMVSTARYVIVTDATAAPDAKSADAKDDAVKSDADAERPIALPCTQCGAPLHVTKESERTIPCEFCKTDVYLPDELWRRLHPVKTMSPWFVRFVGQSHAAALAASEAEAKVETQAREQVEGKKTLRGCLMFFVVLGAIGGLGYAVRNMMSKPPPPVPLTGAELVAVAGTSLSVTPQELASRFQAPRTSRSLHTISDFGDNGWFRPGRPCNGTVCIDTRSDFWGRVEVFWDSKHPDHPNGFSIAMQPGKWVEANDPARKTIGDQLPNGLDSWGRWYRWEDRDISIERNSGVRVFVSADDGLNPEWRTQLDAAWKLVMGVLFKVDVAPTRDELRALVAPTPDHTRGKKGK